MIQVKFPPFEGEQAWCHCQSLQNHQGGRGVNRLDLGGSERTVWKHGGPVGNARMARHIMAGGQLIPSLFAGRRCGYLRQGTAPVLRKFSAVLFGPEASVDLW